MTHRADAHRYVFLFGDDESVAHPLRFHSLVCLYLAHRLATTKTSPFIHSQNSSLLSLLANHGTAWTVLLLFGCDDEHTFFHLGDWCTAHQVPIAHLCKSSLPSTLVWDTPKQGNGPSFLVLSAFSSTPFSSIATMVSTQAAPCSYRFATS